MNIAQYLKIVVLIGIGLASIATSIGIFIIVRFFLIIKKSAKLNYEFRLLGIVMISNFGCFTYNICNVFLYKSYLYAMESDVRLQDASISNTHFYDQLSKSILIFHHYSSIILLICMRLE